MKITTIETDHNLIIRAIGDPNWVKACLETWPSVGNLFEVVSFNKNYGIRKCLTGKKEILENGDIKLIYTFGGTI